MKFLMSIYYSTRIKRKVSKLFLFPFTLLLIWSFTTNEEDPRSMLNKMLQHYNNVDQLAAQYIISVYDEDDESPSYIYKDMKIFVEGNEMYYHNEDYQYYQNEDGSVWLSLQDKVARFIPNDDKLSLSQSLSLEEKASVIGEQMKSLLMFSDTIIYEGQSSSGKDILTLEMNYGDYSKVKFLLNGDNTLSKTIYYYNNRSYGFKSVSELKSLSNDDLQEIKNTIEPIKAALANNTIESYYKNYQFLEVE